MPCAAGNHPFSLQLDIHQVPLNPKIEILLNEHSRSLVPGCADWGKYRMQRSGYVDYQLA